MKLFLAIIWSCVIILMIVKMINGGEPNWIDVFSPLTVLFIDRWLDWATNRPFKRKKKNKYYSIYDIDH